MSDSGTGPGPAGGDEGRQPTEEEVAAYLAQLRAADVGQVVAQAFSVLASGTEVKLGRRDARLLIDAAAALTEAVAGSVAPELAKQLGDAVGQLRLAQVDAEEQLARLRAEGRLPADEAGDLAAEATDEEARGPAERAAPPGASRLWIPGR